MREYRAYFGSWCGTIEFIFRAPDDSCNSKQVFAEAMLWLKRLVASPEIWELNEIKYNNE